FISAADPDGDPLSWTLTIVNCPLWNNLRLADTGVASQKKIIADNAGQAGTCQITITIDDKRPAGQVSQNYSITTVNGNLPIIQPIANQTITVGKDLNFTITASEADLQYPLTIEFSGAPAGLNTTGSGQIIGSNYQFNISGIIIDQTKTYNITAIAYDKYLGASTPVNFTITVENQPPTITSTPVTNATACVDYSYDVNATDLLDGHSVEYFDPASTLPANLTLNQATGLISGQVQAPGNYNITIEARDQYYGQTIAPYSAQASQTYALSVANEVFTVTAPAGGTIYVAPADVPIAGLYYMPITYFGTPIKSTSNTVTWSRTVIPALPAGLTIVINPTTGDINATGDNNATNPGTYTVTVTAANACGAQASDSFTLTVKKNEWCGDNILQTAQGEQCDTTQLNGQTCVTQGFSAGTLGCLSSCTFDTSGCCNSACAGRECGADPASCLTSCPPGCGPNTTCDGSGQCQCKPGYAACDGEETDADGCECNLGTAGCSCVSSACACFCVFDASAYDNCTFQ
ncbi:MAG: Ig domain-containing protein, partial [bacterium]|nr:Ig domain-containing protein [bacterium]